MNSGDETIAGVKTFTSGIVASTITTTSDPKLKKNMTLLDNCLDKIDEIDGYSFNWVSPHMGDHMEYGLNADEIEQLNDGLIKYDPSGFKSVNYNGIVALLLGSIKALKTELAEIKAKI
jgi:hypothetical protein